MTQQIASKVYFGVEAPYIDGKSPDTMRRLAMPMYLCHQGAGADAQLQEEGCFFVTDNQNRLWFCKDITNLNPAEQPFYALQFFKMGRLAQKIGVAEGGKMFHGNADDEDDLKEALSNVE